MDEVSEVVELFGSADPLEPSRNQVAEVFGFKPCCQEAFDQLEHRWAAWLNAKESAGDAFVPVADAAEAAKWLNHEAVVAAFMEWNRQHWGSPHYRDFLGGLAVVPGRDAAAGQYLLARDHFGVGEFDLGIARHHQALEVDPDFRASHYELGLADFDRGDFDSARTHFKAAKLPVRTPIDRLDAQAKRATGRNKPCPCGSGRKYKACHRGQLLETAPLELLMTKVAEFSKQDMQLAKMQLFEVMALGFDPDRAPTAALGFAIELGLHEGQVEKAYLKQRGPLLPVAERELLERQTEAPRRLYRVVEVQSDEEIGNVSVALEPLGSFGVAGSGRSGEPGHASDAEAVDSTGSAGSLRPEVAAGSAVSSWGSGGSAGAGAGAGVGAVGSELEVAGSVGARHLRLVERVAVALPNVCTPAGEYDLLTVGQTVLARLIYLAEDEHSIFGVGAVHLASGPLVVVPEGHEEALIEVMNDDSDFGTGIANWFKEMRQSFGFDESAGVTSFQSRQLSMTAEG